MKKKCVVLCLWKQVPNPTPGLLHTIKRLPQRNTADLNCPGCAHKAHVHTHKHTVGFSIPGQPTLQLPRKNINNFHLQAAALVMNRTEERTGQGRENGQIVEEEKKKRHRANQLTGVKQRAICKSSGLHLTV